MFRYMFGLNGPRSQNHYNLSYVYNEEDQYFTYQGSSNDGLPVWILTAKGQIVDGDSSNSWTPEYCYGCNSGNGCVMDSSLPWCREEGDNFSEKNGDFAPNTTSITSNAKLNLSIGDCFLRCWDDCSCVGFTSSNNGTRCVIWTGSNTFLVNPRGNSSSKYVISSSNISTDRKSKKNTNWIWIIIGVTIPLVFFCWGLLWYLKRKRRQQEDARQKRDEYFIELTAFESFGDVHQPLTDGMQGNDLLLLSFTSVVAATDDFSLENKLGQGGFGPVYMTPILRELFSSCIPLPLHSLRVPNLIK